jgi:hypothetical protein
MVFVADFKLKACFLSKSNAFGPGQKAYSWHGFSQDHGLKAHLVNALMGILPLVKQVLSLT